MIRYIVRDRRTHEWQMTIYADGSREEACDCTNFYIGETVVAQVNPTLVFVDSGGRSEQKGIVHA